MRVRQMPQGLFLSGHFSNRIQMKDLLNWFHTPDDLAIYWPQILGSSADGYQENGHL